MPCCCASRDFADLAAYRRFIDEVIGRRNARLTPRIEVERAVLQEPPGRRTADYEDAIVTVTSTSGFVLRKVFYSVPSRLIGHRLRVRLYDDRLEVYLGGTHQLTAAPWAGSSQRQTWACRRLPACDPFAAAQAHGPDGLVYRDQLFPRQAYARAFEAMIKKLPARVACRTMVDLLALAHERACEAELAERLDADLDAGRLPDLKRLRALFSPEAAAVPAIVVSYAPLSAYEEPCPHAPGRGRMKSSEPIDAGRLTLALSDLRLPAIKTIWPDLAARADKEGWPAARFWRRSPSTRWPSAPAGASSAISTRRGFRPASPSTASTSRWCR